MAYYQVKNNALGAIQNNPLTAVAITLNLQSGQGAKFPSSGVFLITVWDSSTYPNPGNDPNMEIMQVSARSSDALTVVRAKEGTTAVEHAQGQRVEMLITAGFFTDTAYGIFATLGVINFVEEEIPSGLIDGNNTNFTLVYTPISKSVKVYVNGVRYRLTSHYTVSGKVITLLSAPPKDSEIYVDYKTEDTIA